MTVSLVTGGAGFIGSHVVDGLVELGHSVVVVDDLSGGSRSNVNNAATFVEGSILNSDLISSLFGRHQFDHVYHLADVAPIIARSVEIEEAYGQVFNVGADTPCTINALASSIAEGMGVPLRVRYLPERMEVRHASKGYGKEKQHFVNLIAGITLDQG